jgi:hypothetical protein
MKNDIDHQIMWSQFQNKQIQTQAKKIREQSEQIAKMLKDKNKRDEK